MRHLGPTFAPPPDSTAETLNGRASALPASVKRDRPEPNRAGGWLDSLGNDRSDPHPHHCPRRSQRARLLSPCTILESPFKCRNRASLPGLKPTGGRHGRAPKRHCPEGSERRACRACSDTFERGGAFAVSPRRTGNARSRPIANRHLAAMPCIDTSRPSVRPASGSLWDSGIRFWSCSRSRAGVSPFVARLLPRH
jgi:hypothetical protein